MSRRGRLITVNGETKNLTEWAKIVGISLSSMRMRVEKYGEDAGEILIRPKQKSGFKPKLIKVNGELKTIKELADEVGILYESMLKRINKFGVDNTEELIKRKHNNEPRKFITINGVSKSIPEWAKVVGICRYAMYLRVQRYGRDGGENLIKPKFTDAGHKKGVKMNRKKKTNDRKKKTKFEKLFGYTNSELGKLFNKAAPYLFRIIYKHLELLEADIEKGHVGDTAQGCQRLKHFEELWESDCTTCILCPLYKMDKCILGDTPITKEEFTILKYRME